MTDYEVRAAKRMAYTRASRWGALVFIGSSSLLMAAEYQVTGDIAGWKLFVNGAAYGFVASAFIVSFMDGTP